MQVEFDCPDNIVAFNITIFCPDGIRNISKGNGDPDWNMKTKYKYILHPENRKDVKENGDD